MQRDIRRLLTGALFFASSLMISQSLLAQNAGVRDVNSQNPMAAATAQPESQNAKPQSDEVGLLKHQLQLQQKQIEELRTALEKQQQLLERLAQQDKTESGRNQQAAELAPIQSLKSEQAQQSGSSRNERKAAIQQEVNHGALMASTAVPPVVMGSQLGLDQAESSDSGGQQNPALVNSPVKPLPIHIGNATLTPVGFVDATAFFRTRNLGSGIGAQFGSLPFSNTVQGRLSETRLTAQNSRIGLMMDSQFGGNQVRGYLETDFLGVQPANAFVTSNSDSLRLRLYWLNLRRGRFEFLAGQSWSMLTPGRVGISPMPSDIFYSQDMDTNYQVGLTWTRQLQFRFVYHATPNITAGLSLENPQQYVGGAVVLPTGFNSNQVDTGSNTATPNLHPDIIGKLAFDDHAGGKLMHVELAGLLSTFKIFNPTANATTSVTGGGGSLNANLELFKNFHLIATSFYSDGGGRYIFGLGPNFIVRPGNTLSLVHADSGIGGFEYQITPKTMYYGYYGGAYFGRNYSIIPAATLGGAPTYVGFGFPGSPSSANKSIQEATFGIIRTFWKNERYGALQLITQYSYLTRAPWYIAPGNPKNANLSEVYTDIRYVLP
jgi:hypothetical protein